MLMTSERRISILEYICEHRHVTIMNLMDEFNVSRSTIKRDVELLCLTYPIYTIQGTGGGVFAVEGYYVGRKYLSVKQKDLLDRLSTTLTGEDIAIMGSILIKFTKPENKSTGWR